MRPLLRLPPVIGHRGAAGRAPENTLAGLHRAARLGASWVEFDVRLSADGAPVVMHDPTLKRTTGAPGRVSTTPMETLASLDAGAWFDPCFAGETIPSLEAAIACVRDLGLGANVELKPAPGRAAALVENSLRAIARAVRAGRGRPPPPPLLLSSTSRTILDAVRRLAPELPRGLVAHHVPRDWRSAAVRLGCASLHVSAPSLTPARVREIKSAGLWLAVFTVNDPRRAGIFWEWGVDSIFSDFPDLLLAARRGCG
ncbi:MAG: glycerophosphodiester phosphodiesterase family protein [Rhodospirillales bacterium]|nr:glycerophosphodiester phosphodiesterase family protein [Rhodospirillales bacterium]